MESTVALASTSVLVVFVFDGDDGDLVFDDVNGEDGDDTVLAVVAVAVKVAVAVAAVSSLSSLSVLSLHFTFNNDSGLENTVALVLPFFHQLLAAKGMFPTALLLFKLLLPRLLL